MFHGVNAVYKIAPWHPSLGEFDASNSFNKEDARNLRSWGFNIVRLGVMWPGVEPGPRGVYDEDYLNKIQTIVENLAQENIFVLLDFHQDLWHRKFCGEGVPDYVYEACKSSEPAGTPAFPLPAVNTTYPVDENGNPTLEACLTKMFATYYLSAEVGEGFQCLYDNRNDTWGALAGYWTAVAKKFANHANVIGYELINEPFVNIQEPKSFLPKYAEEKYLQPLYEYLHKAIRAVDNEKIIFFEGLTIDYWQNGFTQGPGGVDYNDRQALSYHVYCPTDNGSAAKVLACNILDDYFFSLRVKDAARLGVPMMMTEFGASEDVKSDLAVLEAVAKQADKYQQSWMYWQFKYFQDLTTCTPQGESLYQDDGTVCMDKLKILSRTYPQAVAGAIRSYTFNVATGTFDLSFNPTSRSAGDITEIYVNHDLTYPHGMRVVLSSDDQSVGDAFEVMCPTLRDPSHLVLKQKVAAFTADVTMTVKPCGLKDVGDCTCAI